MRNSIYLLSVVVLSLSCGDCGGGKNTDPDSATGELDHPDSGTGDAGKTVDAGKPDAGLPDSGMTVDAGVPDAGLPDSGVPDAGPMVGCTTGEQCTSGMCLPSGDCFNCQADTECLDGRLCGTGVCFAACATTPDCTGGGECCGGRCVDPQRDPSHCGGCNLGCAANQFCGNSLCRAADLSQVCQLTSATVVLNQLDYDDDAGTSIGAAIATSCTPPVAVRHVSQIDAGVLSVVDGKPLALGELLVMGGGSFRQVGLRWLETNNLAHIRDTSTDADAIYSLVDGGIVSSMPWSMVTEVKDRLVVQIVRAPSGSLVLNTAGFHGPGTVAAAYYFVQNILPVSSGLTASWYVVEWEDLNLSGGPDSGDTFTVIASGT